MNRSDEIIRFGLLWKLYEIVTIRQGHSLATTNTGVY